MTYLGSGEFRFGHLDHFVIKFLPERIHGLKGLSFCHLLPELHGEIVTIDMVEFVAEGFGSVLEKCLQESAHAQIDVVLRVVGGQEFAHFMISWRIAWNRGGMLSVRGMGKGYRTDLSMSAPEDSSVW